MKLKKRQFGHSQVYHLGHIIGQGNIEPDGKKIAAVKKYPTPANKKNIWAFLRLVGYYQYFVPHFATIAIPLKISERRGSQTRSTGQKIVGKLSNS